MAALRHHALTFASSHGAAADVTHAIALAVSEVASNAVLHAYRDGTPGTVELRCSLTGDGIAVEIADHGTGLATRDDSPGLGHGLATVGAHAAALDVRPGPDGRGTVVRMVFGDRRAPEPSPRFDTWCALALEAVADVSCVDVLGDGVLRRVAARVRDDEEESLWLLTCAPPAKPGTATWEAMREGGARLVVHDPDVPRSPGGPGERLGLSWWVAIPVAATEDAPAALWGFGGRAGGRPVPTREQIAQLTASTP